VKKQVEIFNEALKAGQWLREDGQVINGENVTTSEILTHIENAQDGDTTLIKFPIPSHINKVSLRSRMYSRFKGFKVSYKDNMVTFCKRESAYDLAHVVIGMRKGDTKTISRVECRNAGSVRTILYREANKIDMNVTINITRTDVIITCNGPKSAPDKKGEERASLIKWVASLTYDERTRVPLKYINAFPTTSYKTVIHESRYNCHITKNNEVTKLRVSLLRRSGVLVLMVKEIQIGVIDKPAKKNLTANDRRLINLMLVPHKLNFKDIP